MPSIIRDAAVVSVVVSIADAGKVRPGGMAPTLNPSVADAGKVRLGGMAPTLKPASVADAGKVRLGGMARR